MPIYQDQAASGSGGGRSIAASLTSATNAATAGWGSSQDIGATASGLVFTIPAITAEDIAPSLKTISLRNVGTNPVILALSGGTLSSAVGVTISPGSVWVIEAQTLTTAIVTGTNASQTVIGDSGTSTATQTNVLAANTNAANSIFIPGLSFTPKFTGTYQVLASLRALLAGAPGFLIAALFDTLNPTVAITGSQFLAFGASTGSASAQSTGTLSGNFSLVAGRTYQIKAWNNQTNTNIQVLSDTLGFSVLSWNQVTGQAAASAVAGAVAGDRKFSDLLTDHSNWILLNGRLKTTLTTAQQAVATSLGYGFNIPDLRGRMPMGVGAGFPVLSTGGTLLIAQNQLPNINLGSNNYRGVVGGNLNADGSSAGISGIPSWENGASSLSGWPSTPGNVFDIQLNGNVAQQNFLPPYATGNWFVWLGPNAATTSIGQPITPRKITRFTSSGVFTRDPLSIYAIVRAVGGGGSAGGAAATVAGQVSVASSGASGTYLEVMLTAAQIGNSQSITIGAGGGAAGGGVNGANGGSVSMGALFTCPGGAGGLSSPAGNLATTVGASASATAAVATGVIIKSLQGQGSGSAYGSFGVLYSFSSAGSNPLGNGPPGGVAGTSSASLSGNGFGSGSRGAINQGIAAAAPSVPGQQGAMIITEYYN